MDKKSEGLLATKRCKEKVSFNFQTVTVLAPTLLNLFRGCAFHTADSSELAKILWVFFNLSPLHITVSLRVPTPTRAP